MNCTQSNCSPVVILKDNDDGEVWDLGHTMGQSFSTFAAVYLVCIIVISVLCNCVLITVILSKTTLRSTYAHIFVINLAVSDLVTAATTVPFDVDFIIRRIFYHGKLACFVMQVSFWISLPSSLSSLLLLTTERFTAVMFPFTRLRIVHHRYLTPSVIALVWTYNIVTSIIPVILDDEAVQVLDGYCMMDFPLEYGIFQLSVNFSLPVVTICLMNIALYVKARQNKKSLRHKIRMAKSEMERKTSLVKMTEIREDVQAANRILSLVFVTIICWLTYIILVVANISCGNCHSQELTYTGNLINYTSIAINPILYGLINTKIRRELLKKISAICFCINIPQNQNQPSFNSSRRQTYELDMSVNYTRSRTHHESCEIDLTHYQTRRNGVMKEYEKLYQNTDSDEDDERML